MEMTVKHSMCRHIICLVGGSGRSVSDSVILFQQSRPGYWNTLTVITLCGRNKGSPPVNKQVLNNISSPFRNSVDDEATKDSNNQDEVNFLSQRCQLPASNDLVQMIENSIEKKNPASLNFEDNCSKKSSDFMKVCNKYA